MNLEEYKTYIRFGTSSWAFEGWKGIVYFKNYPENRFKRDCLAEYAADGRFGTVGMDLFFYQPPTTTTLQHYATQLPPGFKTCSKVWEQLTINRFPNHSRYGKLRGQLNPNFLNVDIFLNTVLKPYQQAFQDHTGPFIFEFQYTKAADKSLDQFCQDLDRFFSQLPKDFQYSVEIRNKNFLHQNYFDTLKKHNVAHVFNHWSYMPSIGEQLKHDSLTADFIVARVLTPLGMSYEESVDKFEPFNQIIAPLPEMRQDVLKLVELAIQYKKIAYLLINNRAEGSAPLTIEELQKLLRL
ncbi:MAG: DUF72 domain-containing protein [candidate division KSB1 bacterium]|nr:DUF72 domain-containing protein [candidate division KSB1 bacterium]